MIDTHCHVDLYDNPIEIANECEKMDIITIGMTNLPSHFALGYQHIRSYHKVRLALGLHPLYAEEHHSELPMFSRYIDKTSYIGEIGLDFSTEGIASKNIQCKTFERILGSLRTKSKILSIHSRKAEKTVLDYLSHFKMQNAIFHWYTGPLSLIDHIINAGYHFSINPAMIKSNAGKKIIDKIPFDHILTESDGPFIRLGTRQIKPADVNLVHKYLANVYGMEEKLIELHIKNNFSKLIKSIPPTRFD
jgi:TatD DNase family protein